MGQLQMEPDSTPWPCWIEVDLDAIRHNLRSLRAVLPASTLVMAVVKSQAYGHGAIAVARAAMEAGAEWLAVARVREGVQLRRAGLDAPILLLGPFTPSEAELLVAHDLRPTLVDERQARELSRAALDLGRTVPVHMKLDTGLGRYGASLEELRRLLPTVAGLPGLRLEGLYSHFASADSPDLSYAHSQVEAFLDGRRELEAGGHGFALAHMAASAATLAVGGSHLNMVRVGLAMYGLYPAPHLDSGPRLRAALSLRARVARVYRLDAGRSVGYGRTFVADRAITVALVPVGYADGLPRSHSNCGSVLVNGRRAPILGRVSMDQCVVDVSECGPTVVGDEVVLIGSQGDDAITCEQFAQISGTINYEVITSLGYRVPRLYRSGGAVVGVAYLDEGAMEDGRR